MKMESTTFPNRLDTTLCTFTQIYWTSVASLRKENQKRLNNLHQIDIKNVEWVSRSFMLTNHAATMVVNHLSEC